MPSGEHSKGFSGIGATPKAPVFGGENSRLDDAFHMAKEPRLHVKCEKPWHRLAVFLHAQGKTFEEIGERLGHTPQAVSQVIKQPWAQEMLIRETTEAGRDVIEEIYRVYGPETLLEVVDFSKTAKSESVRLDAKKYFIDRWLGKPNQPFSTETKPADKKSDDELRASVNSVLDRIGRLGGVPGASED